MTHAIDPRRATPGAAAAPGYREAAVAYVDAVSRSSLPPAEATRLVEGRDPQGRLRALGLALRDMRQGRPLDAAVRLRGIRLKSAAARRAIAARIELVSRLPARPAQG